MNDCALLFVYIRNYYTVVSFIHYVWMKKTFTLMK